MKDYLARSSQVRAELDQRLAMAGFPKPISKSVFYRIRELMIDLNGDFFGEEKPNPSRFQCSPYRQTQRKPYQTFYAYPKQSRLFLYYLTRWQLFLGSYESVRSFALADLNRIEQLDMRWGDVYRSYEDIDRFFHDSTVLGGVFNDLVA